MPRFIKKRKEEIGLSPDALQFRGTKKMEKILISVIDYDQNDFAEYELKSVKEAAEFRDSPSTTWINIDGVHDNNLMQEIADIYNIDTVILDDVMNTGLRPKMDEEDNLIFISLKMLHLQEQEEMVDYEQVSLIILPHVLITFQERRGDIFEPVRDRIRKKKPRMIGSGSDYLAFALLDVVIDQYIMILTVFGEKIEIMEDKGISQQNEVSLLDDISSYKKELSYLARNIKPVRELITNLAKSDSELIDDNTFIHLNELKNNINHAAELIDNYREILTDQLNIYHTTASSKLNDIIKFLTIFSVIFIPLTFIAGIYGTNFDNLPELHFKYGYYYMWGLMIILAGLMLYFFRRKKWF